jgi:hypothetical protein
MRRPTQRFTHFGQREKTAWPFDQEPVILHVDDCSYLWAA